MSLESIKTVASNKYHAPQGVAEEEKFLLKINIKVQSPREEGGEKEKDRKGRRKRNGGRASSSVN